jgi:multiple sugar transport system permease protein
MSTLASSPGKSAQTRSGRQHRNTMLGHLLLLPLHVQLLLVLALPAAYVFWLSLHESNYGGLGAFVGFNNYARLFTDRAFVQSLVNTFVVVNVIVYIEVAFAVVAALLFHSLRHGKAIMLAVIIAPYAISEVVAVLAWKFLADPNYGLINALLAALGSDPFVWAVSPSQALGLASVISIWLHLPFTFLMIYGGLLGIPNSVIEAARVDGATPLQRFRKVVLPLLMPALLIAIIFRYIFAFRLFSEVWLLTQGGPARKTELLSVYLYKNAFRFNEFGMAAATGWLMVIGSLLVASVYVYLLYRRGFRDAG